MINNIDIAEGTKIKESVALQIHGNNALKVYVLMWRISISGWCGMRVHHVIVCFWIGKEVFCEHVLLVNL